METRKIRVKKSARYFLHGKPGPEVKEIWFICHGYGQLGDHFLNKFSFLSDKRVLLVACEGLSRFYLKGYSGRVGATWMTSEERLDDIRDYTEYLDSVYQEVTRQCQAGNLRITAFGFSQGTATASRWMNSGNSRIDRLILWAGVLPAEMDLNLSREKLNALEIILVNGDQDEFLNDSEIRTVQSALDDSGIKYAWLKFSGKHELHKETLLRLITA